MPDPRCTAQERPAAGRASPAARRASANHDGTAVAAARAFSNAATSLAAWLASAARRAARALRNGSRPVHERIRHRATRSGDPTRPVDHQRVPSGANSSASSTSWGVHPARRNSRTADPTARSDPAQPASAAIRQAAARSSRRVTVSVWSGHLGVASRAREGSSLREETRGVPVTGTASPSADEAVFRGTTRRYTAAWFPCPGRIHSGRTPALDPCSAVARNPCSCHQAIHRATLRRLSPVAAMRPSHVGALVPSGRADRASR